MREPERRTTRRGVLKTLGAAGAAGALGGAGAIPAAESLGAGARPRDFATKLEELVAKTPLVDTHEHLPDEEERLRGEKVACDDWGVLFSHYIDSDLIAAGMPRGERDKLAARGVDPEEKWRALAPFWPAVKNTGYGRAVRLSVKRLYDIDELEANAIGRLQEAYERFRRPGMYRKALVEGAGIESCQVNYLWRPFRESTQPAFLHQDLSFLAMHMHPGAAEIANPAGREVRDLGDWHAAIRWWFETYGPYAVAVKSQAAYGRGLDYERVPAEAAAPVFRRVLAGESVPREERKRLEDHLFWFCVGEATARGLPVKLHTGYYAGDNSMPLSRVAANPADAAELCRRSPETTFVFMHIAYPRWQDLVAVAKHYTNAVVDMCWAWIIDPAAAKEFLKSFLAAAPSTKVLTFGGDYIPVECVVGHAAMARRGVARALAELVEEGWLGPDDALDLVDPLLRGNARRIFRLEEKTERLAKAPWIR